ncbi:nitroreductase family protein [Amycolatopsis oliviviridis]|uniref:NAD(P)H nitroreductase n=1 Tax=Amycolatopsis oliviviridis TaxID=1471590 RepID=A0ABQ3L4X6_9PSEU|nr:nitroreductase [Amycolatopsis oliviviridis]GHH04739.1 NAD(P)H nitroreductase [Amycolatopsis oliviviridis]
MRESNDAVRGQWSDGEVEVLARAAVSAPSTRRGRPWSLSLPGRRVEVTEHVDPAGPSSTSDRLDHLISCGAALANLVLGVRVLGWGARISLAAEEEAPLVGTVVATRRAPPSDRDLHGYSAISRRASHDVEFSRVPVAPDLMARIVRRAPGDVHCRVVHPGELGPLADVFASTRDETELNAWTAAWNIGRVGVRYSPGSGAEPWAEVARSWPLLPDGVKLAARLKRETLVVFCATTQRRPEMVSTGVAMESVWLAAVESGLAASTLTRPLRVPGIRSRLVAELALPGAPGLIMRLGYPAG